MTNKSDQEERKSELLKYRDLLLATIDYYLEYKIFSGIDSTQYLQGLIKIIEEDFNKGNLLRLKQWFHDMTEMQIETEDLKLNRYLNEKTKYDINIFQAYHKRIEKIIENGEITSDNQFYDVNMLVDKLCQKDPIDVERIDLLNKLLSDYEGDKNK